MTPARDRLTIVIPHRNRRDLLLRALSAVDGWRALVVDDTDDGLDLDVPRVRLGGGAGFARAANAGLDAVTTPFAVLLNDDAAPLDDALERLARAGGVCGPVLVGPNGVESAGLRVRSWGRVVQRTAVPLADTVVDALSGACLHLPAHLRFDPRFRHGGEDVELCRRSAAAGLPARIVVGAHCWHEGGATLGRRTESAQRHAVAGQLRLVEPGWRDAVVVTLAAAQVAREGGPVARLRGIRDGWRDARRP
jgi:glycosyltransferase involved in cell wall biosynthesis